MIYVCYIENSPDDVRDFGQGVEGMVAFSTPEAALDWLKQRVDSNSVFYVPDPDSDLMQMGKRKLLQTLDEDGWLALDMLPLQFDEDDECLDCVDEYSGFCLVIRALSLVGSL